MSKWLSFFLVCFATVGRAAVVFPPATQAEVDAGTVKTKFVSPFTLHNTTGLPASSLTTNGNQFGASVTLTIKNGALFTNATIRAIREPNLTVSRVVFNDANGMFTNVTSAAAGTDFVHADGSVGTSTTVLTTNGNQFGASVTLTVKNGPSFTNVISDANTPIVSQATNFIFDGGKGDYYVWGVSNLASTTPFNFIITNLQQKMRIDTWITNGQSVIIQVADGGNGTTVPATWYKDQTVINVDTNGHSSIHLWRNALGTNVAVETRTYGLAAGNNLAIVTNAVAGTLTMHIPASPTFTNTITFVGTVSTQEPQIKLKNTTVNGYLAFSNPTGWVPTNNVSLLITNAIAGDILVVGSAAVSGGVAQLNITNAPASIITGSGSTQMVAAAIGNLTQTNQIIYIPQDYNGSNTVNDYAWDMSLNTFKPVTNFVNTNMVFTLSNITKSASLISEFIGNPGTTNTVLIKAVSGANIKWKGWNTNNNGGGIYVRGGYSYTFQAFADRATNVSAWVTTDDPYAVGPIISIVTNDLVINTRYTNTASTVSYVQCSMTLNASVTDIAQAVLLIDQNGDGTWDAWITNRIGSGVAMADSILMGGWVTNSGIFLITNQSTGSATATINPNSSQRISGFGTGPQGLTGPAGAAASQTPWTTDINGNDFGLYGVDFLVLSNVGGIMSAVYTNGLLLLNQTNISGAAYNGSLVVSNNITVPTNTVQESGIALDGGAFATGANFGAQRARGEMRFVPGATAGSVNGTWVLQTRTNNGAAPLTNITAQTLSGGTGTAVQIGLAGGDSSTLKIGNSASLTGNGGQLLVQNNMQVSGSITPQTTAAGRNLGSGSTIWDGVTASNVFLRTTLFATNGANFPTNSVAMPAAADLGGAGSYAIRNSNGVLVVVYTLDGTTTAMKTLAP